MSTTVAQLTIEEFLELPERDEFKIELVDGEVVEVARANANHEIVKSRLIRSVSAFLDRQERLDLLVETLFVPNSKEGYIPDLSVIQAGNIEANAGKRHFEGVPDLAIEIVSSEPASRLEAKVEVYLRGGAQGVWAVFPELRCVRVYSADGASVLLKEGQALEAPLLPGFRLEISRIFAGL